jgi:hypothetical protein
MFIAVINHALNAQALQLKQIFSRLARTIAIDSGSPLTAAERAGFDLALPNVYYSGLLNAVAEHTALHAPDDPVFIWCSDVTCDDYARLVALARAAFTDPRIGVYAPSAWHSDQAHMRCRRTGGLRHVTFVDGFCFAARNTLLQQLCPIDTRFNRFGWGVELQLAYLAHHGNWQVMIDDRIEVRHPRSTGYCRATACRERGAWQARLPTRPRLFHRLARRSVSKHPLTMRLLLALPW